MGLLDWANFAVMKYADFVVDVIGADFDQRDGCTVVIKYLTDVSVDGFDSLSDFVNRTVKLSQMTE